MQVISREEIDPGTPSCHAATVEYLDGERVLAWFGGTMEGAPDVKLSLQWRGHTVKLGPGAVPLPCWNPVLVTMAGRLLMFMKVGRYCDSWQTFLLELAPSLTGRTLVVRSSTPLPAGMNGPVKNRPIVDGNRLICGSSVETYFRWTSYVEVAERTARGWSFRRSDPIPMGQKAGAGCPGLIQPALWRAADGSFYALMRCGGDNGHVWWSCAKEPLGEWAPALPTGICNPSSGLAVLQAGGGTFLAHNASTLCRYPLVLREISADQTGVRGGTPLELDTITETPDFPATPEVSYPALAETPAGTAMVAYTYQRRKIKLAEVELSGRC